MTLQTECKHFNFKANVNVARLTDGDDGPVTGFSADICIECYDCKLRFRFRGKDYGYSPDVPRLSADGLTLRAPIEPAYTTEICGLPLESGTA
jgi:hypothetical protein